MDSKQQYKLRKLIQELRKYRGRHTELVTVYIPAGYELNKIIQHLAEEQGTASNIKDKTNRLNVQGALDRMIRHLRTAYLQKTPEHGLAVFSGNVSEQEGKQDIKIWSVEPPMPLTIRMYRCDHVFVLEPLEDMMLIKDTYGLLVMDNREATLAFLRGKSIQVIRSFGSNVPGKLQVGGWCLDPETTVISKDYKHMTLSKLKKGDIIKAYDFKKKKIIFTKCINKWESHKKALKIFIEDICIISSEDHLFFVKKDNKVIEVPATKLDFGDILIDDSFSNSKVGCVETFSVGMDLLDIETTAGNFFANGILVHNSQQRYARLREEAENEFYKRIAEVMNPEFLAVKTDLKGILIGGPGPTKEKFHNGDYINNELKKKVIGIKDIAYTDEQGVHELVDKSHDLLAQAELIKEKQIVQEFLTRLATDSDKVAYGMNDVKKALDYGAVDKLLLSESLENIEELEDKANAMGTEVFIVSTETKEGGQLRDIGGVAAILRYAIKEL